MRPLSALSKYFVGSRVRGKDILTGLYMVVVSHFLRVLLIGSKYL